MTDATGSVDDLVQVIDELRRDLAARPEAWENSDLTSYLEALGAWLADTRARWDRPPTWVEVGDMLRAARGYE